MSKWKTKRDGAGTWHFTYDGDGRVSTVDGPWDSDTVTYTYDGLDRVVRIDQQGGESINFAYDLLGRLSTVTVGARIFTYAYSGANMVPASLTRPNGSITYYTYDNLFRLKSISNQDSLNQVLAQNVFAYDKAHMRTQETVTNGLPASFAASTKTYSYNPVNQIASTGYAYDADGNMTTGKTPGGYAFAAQYDAENRLINISYTDGTTNHTASFTYSADNMMAKQVVDGVETRFIRDINFNTLQERDSSNNVTRAYVWDEVSPGGIGGLLELTQGGQHYNYLYDGKGNVSALIDASQNVVEAYKYDSFGNLISKSGTVDQPYMFSTKPYYEGYGKSYNLNRFYDPISGKWMTRDPLGEKADINLYRAMKNNPIAFIDPLGLLTTPTKMAISEGIDLALETAIGYSLITQQYYLAGGLGLIFLLKKGYDTYHTTDTARDYANGIYPKTFQKHFDNISTNSCGH